MFFFISLRCFVGSISVRAATGLDTVLPIIPFLQRFICELCHVLEKTIIYFVFSTRNCVVKIRRYTNVAGKLDARSPERRQITPVN